MEKELKKANKKKQSEAAEQKGGAKIERSLLDSLSSSDENEADLSGDDYAAFGEVRSKKTLEQKFGGADRQGGEDKSDR